MLYWKSRSERRPLRTLKYARYWQHTMLKIVELRKRGVSGNWPCYQVICCFDATTVARAATGGYDDIWLRCLLCTIVGVSLYLARLALVQASWR